LAQVAFDDLKVAMTRTPMLALPNFQEPSIVKTDACQDGIGAVLMQKGQAIAYLSKAWERSIDLYPYMKRSS